MITNLTNSITETVPPESSLKRAKVIKLGLDVHGTHHVVVRQIDAAANQFALENHLTNGDRINFPNDLTPYIKLNREGKIAPCPSGGTYYIQRVGSKPICSLGYTVTPAHVLP